ncbi:MAG: hypothetical protein MJE68_22720 [Proteobacteria bacterium]|nr:hypothetical protein [Pseudomonadota bacterium]
MKEENKGYSNIEENEEQQKYADQLNFAGFHYIKTACCILYVACISFFN